MNTLIPLGAKLRTIRSAHGHRLVDMARLCNLRAAELFAIEQGRKTLDIDTIDLIVKGYGLCDGDRRDLIRLVQQGASWLSK